MFRMSALTRKRMLLAGIALVALGIILAGFSLVKLSAYQKVDALVVETKTVKPNSSDGTSDHYATFRYTVSGREYTTRAKLKGADLFKAKQGSRMKIYCDPKDPTRVTTGGSFLTYAIAAAAAGAACVVISLTSRT